MITLQVLAPNMTQLTIDKTVILFSYNTPVAARSGIGKVLITSTKYSTTTSRHINKWIYDVLNVSNGAYREYVDQSVIDNMLAVRNLSVDETVTT